MRLSSSTWQQAPPPAVSTARADLVAAVARLVCGRGEGRLSVAVDGRTGAGKTSFGHELGLALERVGRPAYRASLDDFKRPWAERGRYDRATGEGYYRNAYDLPRIARDLAGPVHGEGRVRLCGIDPRTQVDHGREIAAMAPDGVLVVDGVFALRAELAPLWDVRIWLDVEAEVALERGLARDLADGASVHAGEARELHRLRYAPAEELYLRETAVVSVADMVVDNTDLASPVLVTGGTAALRPPP